MMHGLASQAADEKTIMVDATYLKAHRTASSLRVKKERPDDQPGRLIGRTRGGMNTKLHAVADAQGRSISLFVTARPVIDYSGAAALLRSFPKAGWMLADRGYDADWFKDSLKNKDINTFMLGQKARKKTVHYDKRCNKRRNRIEIMFGKLKDWRRVATRFDRCPIALLSAIALAATVLFWL